jgi:hypothetical protein
MNDEQSEQRLQKILKGAFSGPPTPLKDIPTRSGESRQLRRPTDTPTTAPTHKPRRLKPKVRPNEADDR